MTATYQHYLFNHSDRSHWTVFFVDYMYYTTVKVACIFISITALMFNSGPMYAVDRDWLPVLVNFLSSVVANCILNLVGP